MKNKNNVSFIKLLIAYVKMHEQTHNARIDIERIPCYSHDNSIQHMFRITLQYISDMKVKIFRHSPLFNSVDDAAAYILNRLSNNSISRNFRFVSPEDLELQLVLAGKFYV